MKTTSTTSGAALIENAFALAISGSISIGMLTTSGALIYCPSGAEVCWVEAKGEGI